MSIDPIADQPSTPTPTRKRRPEETSDANKRVTRSAEALHQEASTPQIPPVKKIQNPSTGKRNPKAQRVTTTASRAGMVPKQPVSRQRIARPRADDELKEDESFKIKKRTIEGETPKSKQRDRKITREFPRITDTPEKRSAHVRSQKEQFTGNQVVDVNAVGMTGQTPLMDAAKNGNIEQIRDLCTQGAKVEATTDFYSRTPLILAAENGHFKAVQILCEHSADVNAEDKHGFTPLMFAAAHGHSEVINILCKFGANVNTANKDGFTPLMLAAQNGHFEAVQILCEHKANVEVTDKYGCTPLMWAAAHGHSEVINILCKFRAQVNATDNNGVTPLMFAAENGHSDAIEILCKFGAQVNATDNNGGTPLILAAQNGHSETIKILCKHKADVMVTNEGVTPLMFAATGGHSEVVITLLDLNADSAAKDKNGNTWLTALKLSHPHKWKMIKGQVKAHRAFNKEGIGNFAKQFMTTKLLSHAFHLAGAIPIQGQLVSLTGSAPQINADTMAQSVTRFVAAYPDILDENSGKALAGALQAMADNSTHNLNEYLKRINASLPTFIPTGCSGHAAVLLITNNRFILCDRAQSNITGPLAVCHRKPESPAVTFDHIRTILDLDFRTYDKYLLDMGNIFELFTDEPSEDDARFVEIAELPCQTVGNCCWASLEGAVKAFILSNKLKGEQFKVPDDVDSLMKQVDFVYDKWQLFEHIERLEKYLKRDDALPESANVAANELDEAHLALECFKVIWASNSHTPPLIDAKIQQRINDLETKYLTLVSDSVQSQFRYEKSLVVTDSIFTRIVPGPVLSAINWLFK